MLWINNEPECWVGSLELKWYLQYWNCLAHISLNKISRYNIWILDQFQKNVPNTEFRSGSHWYLYEETGLDYAG